MRFDYNEPVLGQLAIHGILPTSSTPPELIHDFINALYVYEIRALRRALLAGAFPKMEYASRVEALRLRYPLLSIPFHLWADQIEE
jgi:hypothetical protein